LGLLTGTGGTAAHLPNLLEGQLTRHLNVLGRELTVLGTACRVWKIVGDL
jgi:hypothetical protein